MCSFSLIIPIWVQGSHDMGLHVRWQVYEIDASHGAKQASQRFLSSMNLSWVIDVGLQMTRYVKQVAVMVTEFALEIVLGVAQVLVLLWIRVFVQHQSAD